MIEKKNFVSKRESMRNTNKTENFGILPALGKSNPDSSSSMEKQLPNTVACVKRSYHKHLLVGYVQHVHSAVNTLTDSNISVVFSAAEVLL